MDTTVDGYEARYLSLAEQVRALRQVLDDVLRQLGDLPLEIAHADGASNANWAQYQALLAHRDELLSRLEPILYQRDLAHRAWLAAQENASRQSLDRYRRDVYKPARERYEEARRSVWLAQVGVNVGEGRDEASEAIARQHLAKCEQELERRRVSFQKIRDRWHALQYALECAQIHRRRLEQALAYL